MAINAAVFYDRFLYMLQRSAVDYRIFRDVHPPTTIAAEPETAYDRTFKTYPYFNHHLDADADGGGEKKAGEAGRGAAAVDAPPNDDDERACKFGTPYACNANPGCYWRSGAILSKNCAPTNPNTDHRKCSTYYNTEQRCHSDPMCEWRANSSEKPNRFRCQDRYDSRIQLKPFLISLQDTSSTTSSGTASYITYSLKT